MGGYDYENVNGSVFIRFEDAGYNSVFAKNMGPLFFVLVAYGLMWLPVAGCLAAMKRKTKFKNWTLKVKIYMLSSVIYRLMVLTFFQLSLMACY